MESAYIIFDYIVLGFIAIALLLLVGGVIYFHLYKRNINKALTEKNKPHIRMIAPYKIMTGIVVLLIIIAGVLIFVKWQPLDNLSTASDIEEHAREYQDIGDDWDIEIDLSDTLAAVLAYNDDMSDHTFAIYENANRIGTDYVFRHGGSTTSVERSVRVFKYDGAIALVSMNALHISRIECHDGASYEIDPNAPFVLVIPIGGFDVYGADGNLIDLEQDWWYELTDNAE